MRSNISHFRIRSILALIGLAIAVAACVSPSAGGAAPAGAASGAPAAPAASAAPVGGNGGY